MKAVLNTLKEDLVDVDGDGVITAIVVGVLLSPVILSIVFGFLSL